MSAALADAVCSAAPVGRRKYVERRFGFRADDARRVVEGRASKAQLDRAFKEDGWPIVIEVFDRMLDERLDQHLGNEADSLARHISHLKSMAVGLRVIGGHGPVVMGEGSLTTRSGPGGDLIFSDL